MLHISQSLQFNIIKPKFNVVKLLVQCFNPHMTNSVIISNLDDMNIGKYGNLFHCYHSILDVNAALGSLGHS